MTLNHFIISFYDLDYNGFNYEDIAEYLSTGSDIYNQKAVKISSFFLVKF